MITLRKLSAREIAQLCECGLFGDERGHAHTCRYWRDREIARLRARIDALEAQIALLVSPAARGRHIRVVFDDRPSWRCTECQQNAHCIRCAAVPTNGHEVAA